jgi:sugar lactone lactonase YvrE
MMRKVCFAAAILLAAICAFAEGTRTWQQTTFEDFEKGTANGIAIRSDGRLELAPAFKAITTTPSTYIWSLASDEQGNVYVAAGSPARVYRVTPDGKSSIIFVPKELEVQAIVVDSKGAIYAATSPDGKVYKIEHHAGEVAKKSANSAETTTSSADAKDSSEARPQVPADPSWTSSVFFDPKTKYIWALALDGEGRLYVATGDRGEIFRVGRDGQGGLFFKSDEAHIRALAFDPQGNVIAGSDGSGLVYRISPQGQAFVLYSAPKKEITALAVDRTGNIYAAGVGEKRTGGGAPVPVSGTALAAAAAQAQQAGNPSNAAAPNPPPSLPTPGMGAIGGSEIYQIAPDGSPKRLWASRDDVVYALGLDQRGRLLAGTGNKGKVFSIANDEEFTDLLKASATQVTAFAKGPDGGLYMATSNLGKVFLVSAAPDGEGTYESDVFDARIFSRWGRTEVRGTGDFEIWARSGNVDNPDRNWSTWKQVDLTHDAPVDVPPARFIQWKAILRPGARLPNIENVAVNYLPKNVAPKVDDVNVQVGWRFQAAPHMVGDTAVIPPQRIEQAPPGSRDRSSIAVRWNAHDDNDDSLVYSIYYRGDGEQNWKLLKDGLTDRFYSFDAGLLPDGGYTIKVVASDAPSHSPDEALTDSRESNRFEVDTTPPQVQDLNASADGEQLHITFRAVDGFSEIRRAEFSIDAGPWQYVEPVGQLSDYRVENYDFSAPVPRAVQSPNGAQTSPELSSASVRKNNKNRAANDPIEPAQTLAGEHLVVVRVYDRFDNVGVAKFVIRGK